MGKKRSFGFKYILATVLAATVLIASVAGAVILSLKGDPKLNDLTVAGGQTSDGAGGDKGQSATVSDSVVLLTGADAAAINTSVKSVRSTNKGVFLEVADGTALDALGVGDVFFLEGNDNTPLGECYFGKVASKTVGGNSTSYCFETPMVDEVFDKLTLNCDEVITPDNIDEIITADGVTVTEVDDLQSYFSEDDDSVFTTLSGGTNADVLPLAGVSGSSKLLFEFNLDIFKIIGLSDIDDYGDRSAYEAQEGSRIKVYVADHGTRYHESTCCYVGRSKNEKTLADAVREEYVPCRKCNAPILKDDEGVASFEPKLELQGKLGFEELNYSINYNWDILSGRGLEDLSVSAGGDFLAEVGLHSYFEGEIGGRTTTISLPGNFLKFQGLKEKLVPLAFVSIGTSITPVFTNEQIRNITAAQPVSLGFTIYVDATGKVEVGAEATFKASRHIEYKNDIVKDGVWNLNNHNLDIGDTVTELTLAVEAGGDIDGNVGASIGLYIFNLNAVDLALAEIGVEAEGTLKLACTHNSLGQNEATTEVSYYMRGYLKFLELQVNIRISVDIWALQGGFNYQNTFTALDMTLFEVGKKSPTRYDSQTMSYTSLTAEDSDAVYYKDLNGRLVKESGNRQTVLYREEFFSVCGIDESYIYVTQKNDNFTLDIYRVGKSGEAAARRVAENVKMCLTIDEHNIYYTDNFDDTLLHAIDRETLSDSIFADFSDSVKFMAKTPEGFYIATGGSDFLSMLFGGSTEYFLLNDNGEVIADYGESPEVSQYYVTDEGEYNYARKMTSSGYLRNTAEQVCWLSKDKANSIVTEQVSGWNGNKSGIFVTHSNYDGQGGRYKIVLYRAKDGQCVDVTDVESDQAFFTLCQTDDGSWYYFDQTADELILYSMDKNFQNKTAVKSFSLEELPCSLDKCSMTLMGGRLYFYTLSDNYESAMLYRYDLA